MYGRKCAAGVDEEYVVLLQGRHLRRKRAHRDLDTVLGAEKRLPRARENMLELAQPTTTMDRPPFGELRGVPEA
jgi:hypothetical protein